MSEAELTYILPARLIGAALADEIKEDYEKVKKKLRNTFGKRLFI